MDQRQADAINRAAQFHPMGTNDEHPGFIIGGARVFAYYTTTPSGRPELVIGLDTAGRTVDPAVLAGGRLYHRHEVDGDVIYMDSEPV